MDWTQTLTIIGSTYALLTIMGGALIWVDSNHRRDIEKMDAKWERLFERLLIQDQKKNVQ